MNHAVDYPYAIDENWVIYDDSANDGRLTLHYVPNGYTLAVSAYAAGESLIIGSTLYYVGEDESGISVLHKMDLSAYDADEQTFPEEAGTLLVDQPILTDGKILYLSRFNKGAYSYSEIQYWEQLQCQDFDESKARTYQCYIGPDYCIDREVDDDNTATIWIRRASSNVSTVF